MIRLITITLLSFFSVFIFISIFHRIPLLKGDPAWYVSIVLAWIATPLILSRVWKVKPNPDIIPINPNDPVVTEQIERSRAEFARFRKGLEEGKLEAFIKFPYKFDGEIEHIWGLAHKEADGFIVTSLESLPVGEAPEELFQRFSVKIEDIEDWMLVDGKGKTYGGYSLLALAKVYTRDYGRLPKRHINHLKNFVDFKWPEGA